MNIENLFTAKLIAANYTEAAGNADPYLGEGLFPAEKKMGLDLSWIKAYGGLPVSLAPSAFDAQATFRDRIAFDVIRSEMPFFREGVLLKERDRQDMLRVQSLDDPYANDIIARVFDDQKNLIDGARVVSERMRMSLLFPENGNLGININANSVDYTYNYDQSGAWKSHNYFALSGTDLWTAPTTADPLSQLQALKAAVRAITGEEPRYAAMNAYTFGLLKKTNAILTRVRNMSNTAVSFVSDREVRDVIFDALELEIVVYDRMFRDEAKNTRNFVPNGYVSVFPEGQLGKTVFGTTPEEATLLGNAAADVAIVDTGIAITIEHKPHPAQMITYASEIVLPSYERMDSVGVMKVIA